MSKNILRYEEAKNIYAKIGVDTEAAIAALDKIPVSMHCWQGDDLNGFDHTGPLTGGIQTTGNYPGRARTPEELMADMDKAFSLIPGIKKINIHASYAIFEDGEFADRDELQPKHFEKWAQFAKQRNMGIDFNPTFFSHPMVKDNLTLSSPDEKVRRFWIDHAKCCLEISEYLAKTTGIPCVMNIWIPDGFKDIPADRLEPRRRFKESLDSILQTDYDKSCVYVTLESKVFGIGLESYTVGSAEFCLSYSNDKGITPLMDNGHYHPTEMVSDKISSILLFNENLALHITRPVRWDSDHVVLFDDETREIAKEIVYSGKMEKIFIALDFFDASINRISAWVTGMRNMKKALLYALLSPIASLKKLQNDNKLTELMSWQEELKLFPFSDVWNYYCEISEVPAAHDWYQEVEKYEKEVQLRRGLKK